MRCLRILAVFGMVLFAASFAHAQGFSVGVGFGAPVYDAPPVCTYGYYPYAPYGCAPYGYYGPEWFNGGFFIGAGPWFHAYPGFWAHSGFRDRGWLYFNDHRRDFDGRAFHGGGAYRGRGDVHGGSGFRGGNNFHGGGNVRGGNNFQGGGNSRGAGNFHGGGEAHGGGGFHGGSGHGGGRR